MIDLIPYHAGSLTVWAAGGIIMACDPELERWLGLRLAAFQIWCIRAQVECEEG